MTEDTPEIISDFPEEDESSIESALTINEEDDLSVETVTALTTEETEETTTTTTTTSPFLPVDEQLTYVREDLGWILGLLVAFMVIELCKWSYRFLNIFMPI